MFKEATRVVGIPLKFRNFGKLLHDGISVEATMDDPERIGTQYDSRQVKGTATVHSQDKAHPEKDFLFFQQDSGPQANLSGQEVNRLHIIINRQPNFGRNRLGKVLDRVISHQILWVKDK